MDKKLLESHCWMRGIYTIVDHNNVEDARHLGVQPTGGVMTHMTYYQWVPFLLVGVALLINLPQFCWKRWEGIFVPSKEICDLFYFDCFFSSFQGMKYSV